MSDTGEYWSDQETSQMSETELSAVADFSSHLQLPETLNGAPGAEQCWSDTDSPETTDSDAAAATDAAIYLKLPPIFKFYSHGGEKYRRDVLVLRAGRNVTLYSMSCAEDAQAKFEYVNWTALVELSVCANIPVFTKIANFLDSCSVATAPPAVSTGPHLRPVSFSLYGNPMKIASKLETGGGQTCSVLPTDLNMLISHLMTNAIIDASQYTPHELRKFNQTLRSRECHSVTTLLDDVGKLCSRIKIPVQIDNLRPGSVIGIAAYMEWIRRD